jgi:hypothetical protein
MSIITATEASAFQPSLVTDAGNAAVAVPDPQQQQQQEQQQPTGVLLLLSAAMAVVEAAIAPTPSATPGVGQNVDLVA